MALSAPVRSDKRRHIVETAYALFKRDGFHATGIDRIIAEAGVAKMTLYRHFPAKDDLIVAVLDDRARRFAHRLDRLATEALAPEEKIEAILEWHARWFRSPDFHGCLFAHALAEFGDPSHPVHEAVAAQKDDFRRRMRAVLDDAMPGERAEAAASALFMLIEGATLLAQIGRGDAAIRDARKAAALLLAGSEQLA